MEALYRKYRPTTFADVVGQEHIERTLKNAIEQDKVSHAYLFCGPRGTGKTTTARILAKALLCEKGPTIEPEGTCEECLAIAQGNHPDVYELDAASRTGVENVREEIISRVSYAPTRGKWKIYIIDEVHMLSSAAFNALLKTIEEPPSHVVFILCTTDPQKVPETIQSRCQRFDFHRISLESIVSRLGAVCVKEGVEFEPEALELIAHRAEGGMRNALTSLEQLIAFDAGHVTLEGAQNLLGSLDDTDLSEIVVAIGKRDAVACFSWLAGYVETGADLAQFVQDLAEYVRTMYLLSMAGVEVELDINDAARKAMTKQLPLYGEARLARMLTILGDVSKELRSASNPRLSFEIALTRMIRPESDLTLDALAERVEALEMKLASGGAAAVSAAQPAAQASNPAVQSASFLGFAASATVMGQAPVEASSQPATAQHPAVQQPLANPSAQVRSSAPSAPTQSAAFVQQGSTASSASAASTAQPVAAAQPAAQAHPAVSVTSAKSVAPAQQVAPSQAAAPAASAQVAASAQPAPSAHSAGAVAMTAQVDLSNPAALQRLWHSVTSQLRKINPARGVLFMNAKVSAESSGQGIVVEFGKDSGFAYTAAQKPEVQELLAKTIAQVAGGGIPFRLSLAGGAAPVPDARPMAAAPVAKTANPFATGRPAASASPAQQPYASRPASAATPQQSVAANPAASSIPQQAAAQPAGSAPQQATVAQASAPVASRASASANVQPNSSVRAASQAQPVSQASVAASAQASQPSLTVREGGPVPAGSIPQSAPKPPVSVPFEEDASAAQAAAKPAAVSVPAGANAPAPVQFAPNGQNPAQPASAQGSSPMAGSSASSHPATQAAQPKPSTPAHPVSSQQPAGIMPPEPDPVPYDEVPLDVYGASMPESYDEQYAPASANAPYAAQPSVPAVSANLATASVAAPAAPGLANQPASAAQSSSAVPSASAAQPSPSAPTVPTSASVSGAQASSPAAPASQPGSGSKPDSAEDEQIKSILTNSFGAGIKFQKLSN
jgi:DNA polymerase III subunit gamma/tau